MTLKQNYQNLVFTSVVMVSLWSISSHSQYNEDHLPTEIESRRGPRKTDGFGLKSPASDCKGALCERKSGQIYMFTCSEKGIHVRLCAEIQPVFKREDCVGPEKVFEREKFWSSIDAYLVPWRVTEANEKLSEGVPPDSSGNHTRTSLVNHQHKKLTDAKELRTCEDTLRDEVQRYESFVAWLRPDESSPHLKALADLQRKLDSTSSNLTACQSNIHDVFNILRQVAKDRTELLYAMCTKPLHLVKNSYSQDSVVSRILGLFDLGYFPCGQYGDIDEQKKDCAKANKDLSTKKGLNGSSFHLVSVFLESNGGPYGDKVWFDEKGGREWIHVSAKGVSRIEAVKMCSKAGGRLPTIEELKPALENGLPVIAGGLSFSANYWTESAINTSWLGSNYKPAILRGMIPERGGKAVESLDFKAEVFCTF